MLARTCEFHDTDEELISQIIDKCSSNRLRKKLLQEANLSLDRVLQIAQAAEISNQQIKQFDPFQSPPPQISLKISLINCLLLLVPTEFLNLELPCLPHIQTKEPVIVVEERTTWPTTVK